MLKYKLVKCNNSNSSYMGYYCARAAYDGIIDLDGLVAHMASHNSPFSAGTISGVLKDMVSCIRELLLESKKVKLDDLAIFSLGLASKGAEKREEFTTAGNIAKAYINAIGTGEISKKQLDITARFKEVEEYSKE